MSDKLAPVEVNSERCPETPWWYLVRITRSGPYSLLSVVSGGSVRLKPPGRVELAGANQRL